MKNCLLLKALWLVLSYVLMVDAQSPVFVVDPFSVAAVDSTTVEFSCIAQNAENISYFVNDSSASLEEVIGKGFSSLTEEIISDGTMLRRNLTAHVSSVYNNTRIQCKAMPVGPLSEMANLTVQGPLSSVTNLTSSFPYNSSTVNISWSPPFTLPGTAITGYNISFTSSGTNTNYFTSNVFQEILVSLPETFCNASIEVSPYNGLEGESEPMYACPPVFIAGPDSVAALDGTIVMFTCTVRNASDLHFRVNNLAADFYSTEVFKQLGAETLEDTILRRNLTVIASSLHNNTKIYCKAYHLSNMNLEADSKEAYLTVQGSLFSVSDLSSSFINSSTVNISWSPPFTLPGTAITGYNISVTSNGIATNYFTSDSYYVLHLSNITDSPCNEINITVSGYNGLDGKMNSISALYLPSVPTIDVIPISTMINSNLQLTIEIDVTGLCVGEHPSTINIAFNNIIITDAILPQNTINNILTVNSTLTVLEDQRYTAVVSFSNLAGEFDMTSEMSFNTFGVESIVITDTTGGRVCLECSFYSFSTDTGCTVELVLPGSENYIYRDTFNRRDNTAEGCVSGVTAGEYVVRVYDQSSSELVHEVDKVTVSMPVLLTRTTVSSPTQSSVPVSSFSPSSTPGSGADTLGNVYTLLFSFLLTVGVVFVMNWP